MSIVFRLFVREETNWLNKRARKQFMMATHSAHVLALPSHLGPRRTSPLVHIGISFTFSQWHVTRAAGPFKSAYVRFNIYTFRECSGCDWFSFLSFSVYAIRDEILASIRTKRNPILNLFTFIHQHLRCHNNKWRKWKREDIINQFPKFPKHMNSI